ncbi:MAG TPA: potassium channel family protein [Bacillota bacterium]
MKKGRKMNILPLFFIGAICFIVIKSLSECFQGKVANHTHFPFAEKRFSLEIFYMLLLTYSIVIIGFGLIYFVLSFEGVILVEGDDARSVGIVGSFIHSIYFSGVTLLTIGYGDITPVGIGRFIALIEALIGYVLPTAFVLRLVHHSYDQSRD